MTAETARSLRLGEQVLLDGEVTVTAGYPTIKRLLDTVEAGQSPPLPLQGSALFHMGSSCRQEQGRWVPNYVNPTTSSRFDPFMPRLIRLLGLTAIGGKGGMSRECADAMREVGCVYFAMPGGASALLSDGVVERVATGWDEMIEQFRLSRFRLAGFGPVSVAIDAHGNSLYDQLQQAASARKAAILDELAHDREKAAERRGD